MMKPEQQQIAIEKACGWAYANFNWFLNGDYRDHKPPDYLNCLNACHKMEKVLQIPLGNYLCDTWWSYRSNLVDSCERDHGMQDSEHLDATAAQRAEAFLKTLNLWATSE